MRELITSYSTRYDITTQHNEHTEHRKQPTNTHRHILEPPATSAAAARRTPLRMLRAPFAPISVSAPFSCSPFSLYLSLSLCLTPFYFAREYIARVFHTTSSRSRACTCQPQKRPSPFTSFLITIPTKKTYPTNNHHQPRPQQQPKTIQHEFNVSQKLPGGRHEIERWRWLQAEHESIERQSKSSRQQAIARTGLRQHGCRRNGVPLSNAPVLCAGARWPRRRLGRFAHTQHTQTHICTYNARRTAHNKRTITTHA